MNPVSTHRFGARAAAGRLGSLALAAGLFGAAACAPAMATPEAPAPSVNTSTAAPSPDPRVGLGAGLTTAEEAIWNLRVLSETPPSEPFIGVTNSDLAFTGDYAIQGSYDGFQVWDISNPSQPMLAEGFVCPASQSDVSVYHNLLFVSGEGMGGRLDCGTE
ncbi:MAG: LVIVD repeat-containing protein, partial [Longimicrobiales bacterium]